MRHVNEYELSLYCLVKKDLGGAATPPRPAHQVSPREDTKMQVEAIPLSTSAEPGGSAAPTFKPLRLNFAQVCLYCGIRWCQSPECIAIHAQSEWAVCDDCDGFGTPATCTSCTHGVVQLVPGTTAAQANRVLPERPVDPEVLRFVCPVATGSR